VNSFSLPELSICPGNRIAVFCAIVALELLVFCLPPGWWLAAGLCLLVLVAFFGLLAGVLQGRGEMLVLVWILTFPLGYYFLSFPTEHPLLTLDRLFIGTLLVTVCFAARRDIVRIPQVLRKSGTYWAVFLFFAGLGIPRVMTPLFSARLWLEAFLLPALLAWYVILYLDVRRCLFALHAVTCLMTAYVAAIGLMEIFLQRDLLPLLGGGIIVAGDSSDLTADFLVRPNGPFGSSNSFAMVGIVSLLFLLFLRSTLGSHMPAWQRMLHYLGVSAALLEALLPLFRSVLISLVILLVIDIFYQSGWRRTLRLAAVGITCTLFLLVRVMFPSVFEERTSSANLQARIAQQKQTVALFLDNPINGVGLCNVNAVINNDKYITFYDDTESLGSAHNNLGAILSETGLTGFLPFVASQVLIAKAFWKLRRTNSKDSRSVVKTFLFLFVCYWINGLSLTTAYFADLNLWYMFVLAVLYKVAITSPEVAVASDFGSAVSSPSSTHRLARAYLPSELPIPAKQGRSRHGTE